MTLGEVALSGFVGKPVAKRRHNHALNLRYPDEVVGGRIRVMKGSVVRSTATAFAGAV